MLEKVTQDEQENPGSGAEVFLGGAIWQDAEGNSVRLKYHRMSIQKITEDVNILVTLYWDLCNRLEQRYGKTITISPSIDLNALQEVIIRVDKRRTHAQIFHDINDCAEFRAIALYCYWIVKLHPFYVEISNVKDEREIDFSSAHINEYFACYLYVAVFNSMVNRLKTIYSKDTDYVLGLEKAHLSDSYIKELQYTFRFRDLNKASLAMIFEPQVSILKPPVS